jgi:hypothetical protein
MSNKEKLFLFCVFLFCTGLIIVSCVWNANKFYAGAYSPLIQQSIERKQEVEAYKKAHGDSSDEPHPAGFKESDIDKEHGDRYSTY